MTPTQQETREGSVGSKDPAAEVVGFMRGRSVPCPKCGYDLRDVERAQCPECGEPLELRIGSPQSHFGWLVLAMAPGIFSGVAAVLFVFPIYRTIGLPPGKGVPWPIVVADGFGFISAASVWFMYRNRHRIMVWPTGRQCAAALGVWGIHVVAFVLLFTTLWIVAPSGPTPRVKPAAAPTAPSGFTSP